MSAPKLAQKLRPHGHAGARWPRIRSRWESRSVDEQIHPYRGHSRSPSCTGSRDLPRWRGRSFLRPVPSSRRDLAPHPRNTLPAGTALRRLVSARLREPACSRRSGSRTCCSREVPPRLLGQQPIVHLPDPELEPPPSLPPSPIRRGDLRVERHRRWRLLVIVGSRCGERSFDELAGLHLAGESRPDERSERSVRGRACASLMPAQRWRHPWLHQQRPDAVPVRWPAGGLPGGCVPGPVSAKRVCHFVRRYRSG